MKLRMFWKANEDARSSEPEASFASVASARLDSGLGALPCDLRSASSYGLMACVL